MVICLCATTVRNVPSLPKRVLVINGSPHKDGPTAKLIDAFRKGLPTDAVVDRIDCFRLNPRACDGCGYCSRKDGCSKRDLDEYYTLLEAADVLVYALPVYNLSFPAPMKALIDRSQRYWSARFLRDVRPPIAKPKQVVLMTVSGDDRTAEGEIPEGGDMVERQLRPPLTILHGRLVESIHYFGSDAGNSIQPFLNRAEEAARRVAGTRGTGDDPQDIRLSK